MNQVVSVTRLWGSTSGCRARLFRCVWPQTVWAATTQSAGTLSAAVCDLFLLSFNFSPWVQSAQSTCFWLLYSPTLQSQLTPSRPRSKSGMGALCLTTLRKRDASSSRSRWEWRKSPHFRVRMDPPHTTPCQVNINEFLSRFHMELHLHSLTALHFQLRAAVWGGLCSVRTSGGIKCDNPSFQPGAAGTGAQQCWVIQMSC